MKCVCACVFNMVKRAFDRGYLIGVQVEVTRFSRMLNIVPNDKCGVMVGGRDGVIISMGLYML